MSAVSSASSELFRDVISTRRFLARPASGEISWQR